MAQPPSILGRSAHEHWSGRLYMRRLSALFTWLLLPTPVTPDQLTVTMGLCGAGAAIVLCVPALWATLAAFGLLQVQLLLDCSDGELARWRGQSGGARAIYLDGVGHSTTDGFVLVAVGVHAGGGFAHLNGWTSLGLAAAVLGLLVHAQTDLVYVARARAGLGAPDERSVQPRPDLVRRLRSTLRRLPLNRLLSAWDLSYAAVAAAAADRAGGGLTGSRVLVAVLVGAGGYAAAGHLLSVLTSRRLS